MSANPKIKMTATCRCGEVSFEATGDPIGSVVCYCASCQEGSRQLEALAGADRIREAGGGTAYVLYRKDRVACSKGAEYLKSHKLRETSATNRVAATCCNSAMVMTFDDSKHWVPVYRLRCHGPIPPVEMRICTKFKPSDVTLPNDVPQYTGYPGRFMARLLGAWVAMLLGR